MVEVLRADVSQKPVLKIMLNQYLVEMFKIQAFSEAEIKALGSYPYFDLYWIENTRCPYIIWLEESPAGFAFLRLIEVQEIAEFYVAPKFRASGVGGSAAKQLFDLHKGQWTISVMSENTAARVFWEKVLKNYCGANYEERWSKAKPERPEFYFNNERYP